MSTLTPFPILVGNPAADQRYRSLASFPGTALMVQRRSAVVGVASWRLYSNLSRK